MFSSKENNQVRGKQSEESYCPFPYPFALFESDTFSKIAK